MRLLIILLLLTTGCASLNSVSLTRVPKNRAQPILAEGWTWGILGIYFSNSFVDEAIGDLRKKCRKGKISGVLTKYSTRFFILWTTRTVNLKAFCLQGKRKRTQIGMN